MRITKDQMNGIFQWHLAHCPSFESRPWVNGPPVNQRRIAMIVHSGVHMPNDRPFQFIPHESYRVIPADVRADDLMLSHGETSFDRTAFQRDGNMLFPIDRLRELASEGIISSVADFHYSFGAPMSQEDEELAAREIASLLKKDKVTAVLFPAPTCPGCTRDDAVIAHYIEEEGIATACISAIRPYSEIVKPPRSLWTSSELGRPLGVPNDPAFQKRVLLALLDLLEAPESEGPVLLVDYPEDAPEVENDVTVISCPVYYGDEVKAEGADPMEAAFLREVRAMRPWYDMAVAKRHRTTVGVSHINLDSLGEFIYAFIKGETSENPRKDVELSTTLKAAVEDLRAYYYEGVTSQPGQENASNKTLLDWFWYETLAGKVILELKKACENSPDKSLNMLAERFLVPHSWTYMVQEKGK